MTEKVWIDSDPGHDDLFALILAAMNTSIELIGVSTVAGNQTVEKTTRNAIHTLAIVNSDDVPVYQGQNKPLIGPTKACAEVHGDSGLDLIDSNFEMVFPKLKDPINDLPAVIYMNKVISQQEDNSVNLVATACLTNVALLFTLFPNIEKKIKQIVILGGAMGIGNMTPCAEWNILVDAEAAKIIFDLEKTKIVLIPLEVSHTALVTSDILNRISKLNSNFSNYMIELLKFFSTTYDRVFQMPEPPLHDPLTIAYVISPEIFELKLMRVDIECGSLLSRGQTVCDLYNMSKERKNVNVALKVDVPKFWDLQIGAIEEADKVSCLNK